MVVDLSVTIAPEKTYLQLAQAAPTTTWLAPLQRIVIIALILGTTIVTSSTGQVTLQSVASVSLYWSFVPLLQLAAAIALVASAGARTISLARGVELMLVGHGPWTIWLIIVAALAAVGITNYMPLAAMALVAAAWRTWIVARLCSTALNTSRRGALGRAVLHQGAMWLIIGAYISWAVAIGTRF